MINKTQVYAQDTATNWLPNIEMMGKIANIFGSLSRRHVLVMANNLANQLEEAEKNQADLAKFRETLEKYLKDYVTNGMIAPGEQAYYDASLKSYNEYLKAFDEEIDMARNGKAIEALTHYNWAKISLRISS
jgi:CTP-dependent riboflavin kinase